MLAVTTAAMSLALLGNTLSVSFSPHLENAQLQIVYRCDKNAHHPPFYALNAFEIEASQDYAEVHRVTTPVGQPCMLTVSILRAPKDWDGDYTKLYLGEWRLLLHVEES